MTAQELIAELQKLAPETVVHAFNEDNSEPEEITEVLVGPLTHWPDTDGRWLWRRNLKANEALVV